MQTRVHLLHLSYELQDNGGSDRDTHLGPAMELEVTHTSLGTSLVVCTWYYGDIYIYIYTGK